MTDIKYFAETEKAVKLKLTVEDVDLDEEVTRFVWVPKSQLADDGKPSLWITNGKAKEFYNFNRSECGYNTIWSDAIGNRFSASPTQKEKEFEEKRQQRQKENFDRYEKLVAFAKSKIKGVRNGMKSKTIIEKLQSAGIEFTYDMI